MKRIIPKFFAVLALALLSSCLKDHLPNRPKDRNNRITFVVNISVPPNSATRAIPDRGVEDNRVDEITILLFDAATLKYVDFVRVDTPTDIVTVAGNENLKKFTVLIPKGEYKTLIMANAAQFIDAEYDLDAGTVIGDGSNMTDLFISEIEEAISYTISVSNTTPNIAKYNAKPGSSGYRPFAMSSGREDLTIPLASNDYYTNNPISLLRDVARLNLVVGIPSTADTTFTVSEILLLPYNTKSTIVATPGRWNTTLNPDPLFTPFVNNPNSDVIRPHVQQPAGINYAISYSSADFDTDGNCIYEIFTGEAPASWKTSLIVRGNVKMGSNTYNDRWFKLEFRMPNDQDSLEHVNILRNYSYTLTIKDIGYTGWSTKELALENEAEGIITELEATPEDGLNEIVFNSSNHLAVDRSKIIFFSASAGNEPMRIFTDYDKGWTIEPIGSSWLTVSPMNTGAANVLGTSTPVTLTTTANNTGLIREASFVATAGNLRKTIIVRQLPTAIDVIDNMPVTPWVGAFWKSDQTGERLIRIVRPTTGTLTAIDGDWAAYVLDGADWIVLDTLKSKDNNLWTAGVEPDMNGNDFGFDNTHNVSGSAINIDGIMHATAGSEIYFRIGLKNSIAVGSHRYAVVLLAAKNNTVLQRIWIRQGEDADYLMRPEDNGVGGPWGSPEPRPEAVKFSPYNLTAPTTGTWNSGVHGVQLGNANNVGPLGVFTEYPSQSGAFFQWKNTVADTDNRARYAWDPYTTSALSPSWTFDSNIGSDFWDVLAANHETCPAGYRRPNDGTISATSTGFVVGSEMRQSLWINPIDGGNSPSSANSVWGYYADGFFDRRQIVSSLNNVANSAVSTANRYAAYIGRLMYNPVTYAHLFFPASGLRQSFSGDFADMGREGNYWSSTRGITGPRVMTVSRMDIILFSLATTYGYNIRCVESSCIAPASVTVNRSGSGEPYLGAIELLTSSVSPSNVEEPLTYQWQRYNGSAWVNIPGETTDQCNIIITDVGANQFRVVVTNACGSATGNISITGTPPPPGGSTARITWDDTSHDGTGGYEITYDPRDGGLLFYIGSLVGIYSDHGKVKDMTPPLTPSTDTWHFQDDMAWSPTGTVYPIPSNIPKAPDGTVINSAYHTVANVKAGRGDPCRLVGMNLSYIASTPVGSLTLADVDNGMWRMPTVADSEMFSGLINNNQHGPINPYGPWWWNENMPGHPALGVVGAEFPVRDGGLNPIPFMPAVGYRSTAGTITFQGGLGFFVMSDLIGTNTWHTSVFYSGTILNMNPRNNVEAFTVRCVAQ